MPLFDYSMPRTPRGSYKKARVEAAAAEISPRPPPRAATMRRDSTFERMPRLVREGTSTGLLSPQYAALPVTVCPFDAVRRRPSPKVDAWKKMTIWEKGKQFG